MLNAISKRTVFLLGSDIVAISAAFCAVFSLWAGTGSYFVPHHPSLYFALLLFPAIFHVFDLYSPFKYFYPLQTLSAVSISVAIGMVLLASVFYMDKTFIVGRSILLLIGGALIIQSTLIRLLYDFLFRRRFLRRRTVIVGTGPLAYEVAQVISETPLSGFMVIGFVKSNAESSRIDEIKIPVLGSVKNLISLITQHNIERVILAADSEEHKLLGARFVADIFLKRIEIVSGLAVYEELTGELLYEWMNDYYLLELGKMTIQKNYLRLKRVLDLVLGMVLLVGLLPIGFVAACALRMSGIPKVFFVQERMGRGGVPFRLFKFRTMTEKGRGVKQVNSFAKWIRRYRIDEIPQLINVLRGEMSLIGPRPEIPYFVERSRKLIPFYDIVFSVRPGLTGWAQVKFRYATSVKDYNKKFRYNLYYLKNVSLLLDVLILLRTVRTVLLGREK